MTGFRGFAPAKSRVGGTLKVATFSRDSPKTNHQPPQGTSEGGIVCKKRSGVGKNGVPEGQLCAVDR